MGVWVTSESQRYTRPGAIRGALVAAHVTDLHRRGMGTQQAPVVEIERIGSWRRMVRGNVEGLEIVEIVLDLRPVGDLEAHVPEQGLEAAQRAADGVQAAGTQASAGQADVQALARELFGALRFLQLLTAQAQLLL